MGNHEERAEERTKKLWSLGSYADIAPQFLAMAAHLVDAADVGPDDAVLDVACGTGNVAITAARRGAGVTGLDITPGMLVEGRATAAIAGLDGIDWREGNATDLPFGDDTFDVTLSCVGHMFADSPDAAARELRRVTRTGGRIAFTSWTPTSGVPAMGAVLKKYLPPEPDEPESPFQWGDPTVVRSRLGDGVTDVKFETGTVPWPALSPAHFWEMARTQSGMFIVASERIDEADRPAFRSEMIEAIANYFDDARNAVEMEYRLTRATVR